MKVYGVLFAAIGTTLFHHVIAADSFDPSRSATHFLQTRDRCACKQHCFPRTEKCEICLKGHKYVTGCNDAQDASDCIDFCDYSHDVNTGYTPFMDCLQVKENCVMFAPGKRAYVNCIRNVYMRATGTLRDQEMAQGVFYCSGFMEG